MLSDIVYILKLKTRASLNTISLFKAKFAPDMARGGHRSSFDTLLWNIEDDEMVGFTGMLELNRNHRYFPYKLFVLFFKHN